MSFLTTSDICYLKCGGSKAIKFGRNSYLHWDYNLTKNYLFLRGLRWKYLIYMLIWCGITALYLEDGWGILICDQAGSPPYITQWVCSNSEMKYKDDKLWGVITVHSSFPFTRDVENDMNWVRHYEIRIHSMKCWKWMCEDC
jgi:hypothetical protein